MYNAGRTAARPPRIRRRPFHAPLSAAIGAAPTQLGQGCQERPAQDRADPGHASRQVVLLAPRRGRADLAVEVGFQPPQVGLDVAGHPPRGCRGQAGLLHRGHLHQPAAAGEQGLQLAGLGVGRRPGFPLQDAAERGQAPRVDRVGLRQVPHRPGEGGGLLGVDDVDRPAGGLSGRRGGARRATSSAWPSGVKAGPSSIATSSEALETSIPTNVSGAAGASMA
jgi:hypothetical protein